MLDSYSFSPEKLRDYDPQLFLTRREVDELVEIAREDLYKENAKFSALTREVRSLSDRKHGDHRKEDALNELARLEGLVLEIKTRIRTLVEEKKQLKAELEEDQEGI